MHYAKSLQILRCSDLADFVVAAKCQELEVSVVLYSVKLDKIALLDAYFIAKNIKTHQTEHFQTGGSEDQTVRSTGTLNLI